MPSATSLYASGRGFNEAAKMIRSSQYYPGKEVQVKLPIDLLVSYAIELLLKAFLRRAGWTDRQIRAMAVRHNLPALHEAALGLGLGDIHPLLPELINALGPHHLIHSTRYMPEGAEYPLFEHRLVFEAVNLLDDRVRQYTNAEALIAAVG